MKNTSWGAIQIDDGESIQYLELPFSNVRLPFEINATIEPIQFEIMLDGKPHSATVQEIKESWDGWTRYGRVENPLKTNTYAQHIF